MVYYIITSPYRKSNGVLCTANELLHKLWLLTLDHVDNSGILNLLGNSN